MALKAIILDVDGTIAETADVKRAAFNQAFAEIGLDWVWGRVVFQNILACTLPGGEATYFARNRHPDLLNQLARNGALDQVQKRQQVIYRGLLETGAAQLRPGIARLMAEAIAGRVKLALCSTGPRQDFETLLYNRFGHEMLDALTTSVAAEDLTRTTVAQAYRLCLERLKIPAQHAIVIEDSSLGCAAANRLGLTVVATPSQYTMGEKFREAALVISDLGHPAAPFTVLQGDAAGINYTTLAALRIWQGRSQLTASVAA